MENFCVIETGGKQYKVKEGDKIKVEKLDGGEKEKVEFDKVLLSYKNISLKI
jgi:large subunit ribosomal protein L21